ncbi:MAG: hypothetical protein Q8O22_04530 [Candidatus Omnitrophota bacterium]|nr:hypothetical protein [Candidatus Omnitrophota bacterium]
MNIGKPKHGPFIVVDLSSGLKLLSAGFSGEAVIEAFKVCAPVSSEPQAAWKKEAVLESLRAFIKVNNIRAKDVLFVPPLRSLIIKRIRLSAVPDAELEDVARWHLKDDLPFDVSLAVVAYQVAARLTLEDGSKSIDLVCAVAPIEQVKDYVMLFRQAGFNCALVLPAPLGYAGLIENYLPQINKGVVAALHLEDELCYLGIYKNSRLDFYREIPASVNKIKQALSAILVTEKTGKVQLTPEDINDILFNYGIPQEGALPYKDKISSAQIMAMVRPVLEGLAQEIKRSLLYCDANFQGGRVDILFLGAKAAQIPNLDKFLSKELSLDAQAFGLKDKIKASAAVDPVLAPQACSLLGLGLRLPDLNLMPPQLRVEKSARVQKASLRWLIIAVFILSLFLSFLAAARISACKKRLLAARIYLETLSEVKQTKEKITALSDFFAKASEENAILVPLLKKISTVAPRELFLNELNLDFGAGSGFAGGFVKNKGVDAESILTKFVTDVDSSGYVADAVIDSVLKASLDGEEISNFRINLKLR